MVIFGLKSPQKDEVECNKTSLLPLCGIESLDLLRMSVQKGVSCLKIPSSPDFAVIL